MSIAEKLTTVAENQEKVYKAGQSSMVDESKIIEKTVTGTNVVVIDDTSEIPHDVGCKVESVNLFGLEMVTDTDSNGYTIEDGVVTNNMSIYNRTFWLTVEPFVLGTGSYKLSFDARKNRPDGQRNIITRLRFSDGTYTNIDSNAAQLISYETWEHKVIANPFVLEEEKTVTGIALVCVGIKNDAVDDTSDAQMQFKNIMLNRGDTALPYTPYVDVSGVTVKRYGESETDNPQTYTANADGTVDGIKSLCPVMTLSTDVEVVELTVDYHKSWGKQEALSAVWDSIQQNGQRTDYSYAFRNESFTTETFKPKYDICPTNAREMFRSNSGIIEEISEKALGVKFDTSQCTDMRNMFYSDKVKKVGTLSTLGLTNGAAYELQQVFSYNTTITEIEKLILKEDGSQSFTDTFLWCSKLKEIRFEGVIGQNISFSYCPLSRESLIDIIDHLSSTASGKTLTLKSSAVTDAFGSTEDSSWLDLIAMKSNWTITLA